MSSCRRGNNVPIVQWSTKHYTNKLMMNQHKNWWWINTKTDDEPTQKLMMNQHKKWWWTNTKTDDEPTQKLMMNQHKNWWWINTKSDDEPTQKLMMNQHKNWWWICTTSAKIHRKLGFACLAARWSPLNNRALCLSTMLNPALIDSPSIYEFWLSIWYPQACLNNVVYSVVNINL
jgi:hypothetical protein